MLGVTTSDMPEMYTLSRRGLANDLAGFELATNKQKNMLK